MGCSAHIRRSQRLDVRDGYQVDPARLRSIPVASRAVYGVVGWVEGLVPTWVGLVREGYGLKMRAGRVTLVMSEHS